MGLCAALRELHCGAIYPLRQAMFWDADVRGAPALFARYRGRMLQLLKEVPVPADDIYPGPHKLDAGGLMSLQLCMAQANCFILPDCTT